MKNYYKILGVTKDSSEEEIRKSYRKLAMRYHPDRNPDNANAEEMFKDVAEAYGVLMDPVKRREYDACADQTKTNTQYGKAAEGFSYSQEDILRDLFNDPNFQQMLMGLLKEFQRSGFRSSPHFLRQCFLGGKGGFFFGGLFVFGSIAGPTIINAATKVLSGKSPFLKLIGSSVSSLLGYEKKKEELDDKKKWDVFYHVPLTKGELQNGKWLQVALPGKKGKEVIKVKIPAASKPGIKLRVAGKGGVGPFGRGDLFLVLEEG